MEMSRKFIYEAVALVVTVLLIYAGLSIYSKGKLVTDEVNKKQEEALKNTKEFEIVQLDGLIVHGAAAVNYIKTVVGTHEIPVELVKGSDTFVISDESHFSDLRNISTDYYINPVKTYHCEVVYDANETITKVIITQK